MFKYLNVEYGCCTYRKHFHILVYFPWILLLTVMTKSKRLFSIQGMREDAFMGTYPSFFRLCKYLLKLTNGVLNATSSILKLDILGKIPFIAQSPVPAHSQGRECKADQIVTSLPVPCDQSDISAPSTNRIEDSSSLQTCN